MPPDHAAYVSALQGRPWTPEQNCWALVRDVQRDLFGRDLPAFEIQDRLTARELVRAFGQYPEERQRWVQVAIPQDGAIVLMHRNGAHARAIHAGVFLGLDGGGILHVDEPQGVAYETPFELLMRNWRCEFYGPR